MALTSIDGNCKGIPYRVDSMKKSEHCDFLFVYVHKDLFKWQVREIETKRMAFLGYEWTVRLTAEEDGRIGVFWCLRSPIEEREPFQCCWMMTSPRFTIGPSSPLEQNSLYGGIFEILNVDSDGFLHIQLFFQLHSSRQVLTAHDNGYDLYCEMPVILKEDGRLTERGMSFRTDRFIWQEREWGLCLKMDGLMPTGIAVSILSAAADSTRRKFLVETVLEDASSPELDYATSKQISEEDSGNTLLRFDIPVKSGGRNPYSYKREAQLKLRLRLELADVPPTTTEEDLTCPFDKQRIKIEVLTDEFIKQHVEKEGVIDISGAPRNPVYLCPPQQSLNALKQTMQREGELDPACLTIWLFPERKDGVFPEMVCINELEGFNLRLFELSAQYNQKDDYTITFYCRSSKEPIEYHESPVVMFCMLWDPLTGMLEFLGSILVNGNSRLYSVCFIDICGLREGLEDAECSFFITDTEERITKLYAFQKTVKASGLKSGSTIVVRLAAEEEDVSTDKVRQELQERRLELVLSQTTLNVPPTNDSSANQDALCVVCQRKPQTSGFYHAETVHICACEKCARRIYSHKPRRCPVCLERFTGFVAKIF